MIMKHSSVLFLALLSATAGFPQVTLNTIPARALGQPILIPESGTPNLVEGRELYSPQGIAVDPPTGTPLYVYVADTGNNRVLAWKNAASFSNGAVADLVIGQPDRYSTVAYGPGTTFSTGLSSPTGLAVRNGDLYVVDSGNNRVLRYPKPFSHTGQVFPDLYIGQPNLNSNALNQPNGQATAPSAQGIYTQGLVANITFDLSGNLWLTDPGNRRVLRFPAASIAKGGGGQAADLVLGQNDFITETTPLLDPTNVNSQTWKNQFAVPDGIAFDTASPNHLFVSDSDPSGGALAGRVLVFTGPFGSSMNADRIMGVLQQPASGTLTQTQYDRTLMRNPQGIFVLPTNQVGVVDTNSNRILIFDPVSKWAPESTLYSPQATAIVGQANGCLQYPSGACRAFNNGNPSPSASTLSVPSAVALAGTDLLIADAGNNRVLGMPQQAGAYVSANRVLGQDRFDTFSVNLIEGREFSFVSQVIAQSGSKYVGISCRDAALAVDSTGDTPRLYVADPCNHRVLGFKDARKVTPGATADLVIGQPDMQTALCNYPSGDINSPAKSSLCDPIGLLVDSSGNLYVADSGNGRVLRFPAPFVHLGVLPAADRVVGQANFTSKITDPTTTTMAAPYGLAFSGANGVMVSDVQHNRVLYFPMASGDLTSPQGEAATKVFGQPDFNRSIAAGSDDTSMNAPHHIAADTSGRLYVADTGNNRILIFADPHDPNTASTHAHAIQPILPARAPQGVYVGPLYGEVWVTDTGNGRCLRFPYPEEYYLTGTYSSNIIPAWGATLAVTEDQYGDLIVADSVNRVEFYYPGLAGVNAASSFPTQPLAPGAFASVYSAGTFGADLPALGVDVSSLPNPLPFPTLLADVQVLFNGQPAPVKYVSPGQINFLIPMSAPTSGTAEVQVVRQSTGQIVGDGLVAMNTVSPAIFAGSLANCSLAGGRCRQAAVTNDADGTPNGPNNAAAAGSYISIYATGQGFVQGAPPDGDVPRAGVVPTSVMPHVWINACDVADSNCTHETGVDTVSFSGLSPQFPGIWQINVRIPKNTGPGAQVPILVLMNSYASQSVATGYVTTIAVKNQ